MTRPFIADWVLDRIFDNRAEEVKQRFLVHEHDDIWSLKSECDTERKVEAMNLDAELTNGLYALIRNVLFVRDHKNPLLYHPRIAVQNDTAYETLWQHDKDNFNRLYNDYFYRRNNQFWYEEAMKKLPLLVDATDMLVCAEDLGMVPDCVPWVLNQLQILSLELISMPKDSSVRFGVLDRNPWRSVCTISSHDSATMRMWWDEDESMIQGFYNDYLGYDGAAPHPMPGWLAQDMLQRHLNCPSALCILTLQDWLACNERMRLPEAGAERINIPANPRHYWRYRMHLNIEDLMEAIEFNTQITGMICQSGR
jgi:4-alpha-glucanotransferase